ncbi:hypothetical protein J3458_000972 [Metarhizium acridum]|uniref:uncharacterized protein n=1 Tax=Metarhizium acridum TaxID=92637 RepID=UPI001C6CEE5D|nr:hypothetical protein J3458_000972 [Metarhizium acridum]
MVCVYGEDCLSSTRQMQAESGKCGRSITHDSKRHGLGTASAKRPRKVHIYLTQKYRPTRARMKRRSDEANNGHDTCRRNVKLTEDRGHQTTAPCLRRKIKASGVD